MFESWGLKLGIAATAAVVIGLVAWRIDVSYKASAALAQEIAGRAADKKAYEAVLADVQLGANALALRLNAIEADRQTQDRARDEALAQAKAALSAATRKVLSDVPETRNCDYRRSVIDGLRNGAKRASNARAFALKGD